MKVLSPMQQKIRRRRTHWNRDLFIGLFSFCFAKKKKKNVSFDAGPLKRNVATVSKKKNATFSTPKRTHTHTHTQRETGDTCGSGGIVSLSKRG